MNCVAIPIDPSTALATGLVGAEPEDWYTRDEWLFEEHGYPPTPVVTPERWAELRALGYPSIDEVPF